MEAVIHAKPLDETEAATLRNLVDVVREGGGSVEFTPDRAAEVLGSELFWRAKHSTLAVAVARLSEFVAQRSHEGLVNAADVLRELEAMMARDLADYRDGPGRLELKRAATSPTPRVLAYVALALADRGRIAAQAPGATGEELRVIAHELSIKLLDLSRTLLGVPFPAAERLTIARLVANEACQLRARRILLETDFEDIARVLSSDILPVLRAENGASHE